MKNYKRSLRNFCLMNVCKNEFQVQVQVSRYLNRYYPEVEYRVDYAGNNLGKIAASNMKKVNKRNSWPDLEIYDSSYPFVGLCIDLKKENERLIMLKDSKVCKVIGYRGRSKVKRIPILESRKRLKGEWKELHTEKQANVFSLLGDRGRAAGFGVGLENCLKIIEGYLNQDWLLMYEGFQFDKLPYAKSLQITHQELTTNSAIPNHG